MSGQQFVDELHEQFLTCKICFDNYRRPKTLSCLHTFCQDCIEKHINAEEERSRFLRYSHHVTCPVCRTKTDIPSGGVRKLPDNFLLDNLGDIVHRRTPTKSQLEATCGICKQDEGVSKCVECTKVLCANCVDMHKKTSVTKNHNLIDLTAESNTNCPSHPDEPVRFYCEDCEECICVLCTFNEHKDHDVLSFSEGLSKYRETVLHDISACKVQSDTLRGQLALADDCKLTMKSLEEEITAAAIQWIAEVRAKEKELLEQLHDFFGEGIQKLIEQKDVMQDRLAEMEAVSAFSELIKGEGGVEILLVRKQLAEKVQQFDEMKSMPAAKFQKAPNVEFTTGFLDFGSLTSDSMSIYNLQKDGMSLHLKVPKAERREGSVDKEVQTCQAEATICLNVDTTPAVDPPSELRKHDSSSQSEVESPSKLRALIDGTLEVKAKTFSDQTVQTDKPKVQHRPSSTVGLVRIAHAGSMTDRVQTKVAHKAVYTSDDLISNGQESTKRDTTSFPVFLEFQQGQPQTTTPKPPQVRHTASDPIVFNGPGKVEAGVQCNRRSVTFSVDAVAPHAAAVLPSTSWSEGNTDNTSSSTRIKSAVTEAERCPPTATKTSTTVGQTSMNSIMSTRNVAASVSPLSRSKTVQTDSPKESQPPEKKVNKATNTVRGKCRSVLTNTEVAEAPQETSTPTKPTQRNVGVYVTPVMTSTECQTPTVRKLCRGMATDAVKKASKASSTQLSVSHVSVSTAGVEVANKQTETALYECLKKNSDTSESGTCMPPITLVHQQTCTSGPEMTHVTTNTDAVALSSIGQYVNPGILGSLVSAEVGTEDLVTLVDKEIEATVLSCHNGTSMNNSVKTDDRAVGHCPDYADGCTSMGSSVCLRTQGTTYEHETLSTGTTMHSSVFTEDATTESNVAVTSTASMCKEETCSSQTTMQSNMQMEDASTSIDISVNTAGTTMESEVTTEDKDSQSSILKRSVLCSCKPLSVDQETSMQSCVNVTDSEIQNATAMTSVGSMHAPSNADCMTTMDSSVTVQSQGVQNVCVSPSRSVGCHISADIDVASTQTVQHQTKEQSVGREEGSVRISDTTSQTAAKPKGVDKATECSCEVLKSPMKDSFTSMNSYVLTKNKRLAKHPHWRECATQFSPKQQTVGVHAETCTAQQDKALSRESSTSTEGLTGFILEGILPKDKAEVSACRPPIVKSQSTTGADIESINPHVSSVQMSIKKIGQPLAHTTTTTTQTESCPVEVETKCTCASGIPSVAGETSQEASPASNLFVASMSSKFNNQAQTEEHNFQKPSKFFDDPRTRRKVVFADSERSVGSPKLRFLGKSSFNVTPSVEDSSRSTSQASFYLPQTELYSPSGLVTKRSRSLDSCMWASSSAWDLVFEGPGEDPIKLLSKPVSAAENSSPKATAFALVSGMQEAPKASARAHETTDQSTMTDPSIVETKIGECISKLKNVHTILDQHQQTPPSSPKTPSRIPQFELQPQQQHALPLNSQPAAQQPHGEQSIQHSSSVTHTPNQHISRGTRVPLLGQSHLRSTTETKDKPRRSKSSDSVLSNGRQGSTNRQYRSYMYTRLQQSSESKESTTPLQNQGVSPNRNILLMKSSSIDYSPVGEHKPPPAVEQSSSLPGKYRSLSQNPSVVKSFSERKPKLGSIPSTKAVVIDEPLHEPQKPTTPREAWLTSQPVSKLPVAAFSSPLTSQHPKSTKTAPPPDPAQVMPQAETTYDTPKVAKLKTIKRMTDKIRGKTKTKLQELQPGLSPQRAGGKEVKGAEGVEDAKPPPVPPGRSKKFSKYRKKGSSHDQRKNERYLSSSSDSEDYGFAPHKPRSKPFTPGSKQENLNPYVPPPQNPAASPLKSRKTLTLRTNVATTPEGMRSRGISPEVSSRKEVTPMEKSPNVTALKKNQKTGGTLV